jgi:hypothetical protein
VKQISKKAKKQCTLFCIYIYCITLSCCTNRACGPGTHESIAIVNNSNQTINWEREDSPDSVWTLNGSSILGINDRAILAGKTYYVGAGLNGCWEEYYKEVKYPIYYFLFSHDTVEQIGWKKISGTSRGLLKKVKVDNDYLKANNFTIAYP